MKRCYACGLEKDESEFYKDKSRKDGLSSKCKSCTNLQYQKWREAHQDYNTDRKREWRTQHRELHLEAAVRHRERFMSLIRSYKHQCVKCGESREYIIDFHHINNADKLFTIGSTRGSYQATVNEIKKCVCLCRNCHSEFHYLYGNTPVDPVGALEQYLGTDPYSLVPAESEVTT